MPHCLNITEFSQEELRDNLCLRYGLMPQDTHMTCNGFNNKLFIYHAISYPRGGLVLVQHDNATSECGALGAQYITSSAIYYKPLINSRPI